MVIIVFGLPGSGKSYFAAQLANRIHADYINSDRLRKELFDKRNYSDRGKSIVYDAMLEAMKVLISRGKSIVLDATFYKNDIRKAFIQEVKGRAIIFFIEVVANENLIRERLSQKRTDSEADFGVFELIRRQWEPFEESHLILESTNENINEMLQKATEYLENDKRSDQYTGK